jgi:hypothetical protein
MLSIFSVNNSKSSSWIRHAYKSWVCCTWNQLRRVDNWVHPFFYLLNVKYFKVKKKLINFYLKKNLIKILRHRRIGYNFKKIIDQRKQIYLRIPSWKNRRQKFFSKNFKIKIPSCFQPIKVKIYSTIDLRWLE